MPSQSPTAPTVHIYQITSASGVKTVRDRVTALGNSELPSRQVDLITSLHTLRVAPCGYTSSYRYYQILSGQGAMHYYYVSPTGIVRNLSYQGQLRKYVTY